MHDSTESGDNVCVGDSQVFIAATTGSLGRGHNDVFEASGSGWAQGQRLTGSNEQNGDLFEFSMAQAGSRLIVGAPQCDAAPNDNRGRVMIFEHEAGRWVEC